MTEEFHSTDRKPADYLLFAIAFVGFVIGAGGIITSSPGLALTGAILVLLGLLGLLSRVSSAG